MTTPTQSLSLMDLVNRLEKVASDGATPEEATEIKKGETEAEAKLRKAEADLKEAEKAEERVKEAHLKGAALAADIQRRMASTQTQETPMNKSAQFAGQALAQALLKQAAAGDVNTHDGVPAGVVPNKAQVDNAWMTSQSDDTVMTTPTTDAIGNNGGSVNAIFDNIIQRAMAQGASSTDQVHGTGLAGLEGAVEQRVSPENTPEDEVEKVAAVAALVDSGFDFGQAVSMVKQAETQILAERHEQVKQAALVNLLGNGVDFDTAVSLVKSAGVGEYAHKAYGAAKGYATRGAEAARGAYGAAKSHAGAIGGKARDDAEAFAHGIRQAVSGIEHPHYPGYEVEAERLEGLRKAFGTHTGKALAGLGAVGAAGAGVAGYRHLTQEKQAALGMVLDCGIDFDTATSLVQASSQELYGV